MLALRELQAGFRDALLNRSEEGVLHCVRSNGVAPSRRLAAYRNNVFHNYCEALRAVYPVVERLVGEDFLSAAAACYIATHPSISGDLHDYGRDFGAFLEGFGPAAALPYLGDVARLEWLWHECFHAAEHPPLSLQALAAVAEESPDALRFRLHPACRFLASPYPVGKIWSVNQPEWAGDRCVDIEADGCARLLLRRDGFAVVIESLGDGDFAMLLALRDGTALGPACERACAADAQFDLSAFLQRQVQSRVIVDFAVSPM